VRLHRARHRLAREIGERPTPGRSGELSPTRLPGKSEGTW
jgi:hypothetical protein